VKNFHLGRSDYLIIICEEAYFLLEVHFLFVGIEVISKFGRFPALEIGLVHCFGF
jgi:hypothetical protein